MPGHHVSKHRRSRRAELLSLPCQPELLPVQPEPELSPVQPEPELDQNQPDPELDQNQPDPELDHIPLHELHANLYETDLFADQYAADLFGYLLDDGEEEEGVTLIRPVEFTKKDLESDRRMWAVYVRYVLFKHLPRTIKEMRLRFYTFYLYAIRVYQREKGEMSDFCSLGARCDMTDWEKGYLNNESTTKGLKSLQQGKKKPARRVHRSYIRMTNERKRMKLRELQERYTS